MVKKFVKRSLNAKDDEIEYIPIFIASYAGSPKRLKEELEKHGIKFYLIKDLIFNEIKTAIIR